MTNKQLLKLLKVATDELQLKEDLKKAKEANLVNAEENDDENEDLQGNKALLISTDKYNQLLLTYNMLAK